MATDLSNANTFPHFKVIESQGTTWNEIILPGNVNTVTIGSETSKIFVGQNNCSDGGTPQSEKGFVPSGNLLSLKLGRGQNKPTSIFVAASSGTTHITVILEEK